MNLFRCCLCSLVGVPLNDFSSVTQFTIFLEAICCDLGLMCLFYVEILDIYFFT